MIRLLAIVYVLVGLLFIGVAIPLVLEKVPPNPWYGFRVPQTLNNPAVWYPANAYCGWLLIVFGFVLALVAIILAFVPNLSAEAYAVAATVVMLVGLALVLV